MDSQRAGRRIRGGELVNSSRSIGLAVAKCVLAVTCTGPLGGCVVVDRVEVPGTGGAVCTPDDGKRVACEYRTPVATRTYRSRSRLRATRADLQRHGVSMVGDSVCLVSTRRGFDCVHAVMGDRVSARDSARLRDRSFAVWDSGLCVEVARDREWSRMECLGLTAGVESRAEFWIPTEHEASVFEGGACFCSGERPSLHASHGPDEGRVGAACFFRDGEVPLPRGFERRVDAMERLVMVRGLGADEDYLGVCGAVEGLSSERAGEVVESWTMGRTALPGAGDGESTEQGERHELDVEPTAPNID